MKKNTPRPPELEREYRAALAYYQRTVWSHVKGFPLSGAQYAVAFLAWNRLCNAQEQWFRSLSAFDAETAAVVGKEPKCETLRPRRLERDNTVTAEMLTHGALMRLSARKPQSLRSAIQEVHRVFLEARDYLNGLPDANTKVGWELDIYETSVSFHEIVESLGKADLVPLLPTVQKLRNSGRMTLKGVRLALQRELEYMPVEKRTELRPTIQKALKTGLISCEVLENIRWSRFRRSWKG